VIGFVFIQTTELTSDEHKSIYTFKMVCITGTKFMYSNFDIKEGIVHSIFLLYFQYCYVVEFFIDSSLVKMKGNINKEMVEKIKRRECLESKLGDN